MNDYCHDINETICDRCGESLDWDANYCVDCEDYATGCTSYCLTCDDYINESYYDACSMYCSKYLHAANTIQIKYKYYRIKTIKQILSKGLITDCVKNIILYV